MSHLSLPQAFRNRKILALAMASSLILGSAGAADAAYRYSNSTRIYACVNNRPRSLESSHRGPATEPAGPARRS
ncbi:MAG: hypothetical protein QOI09_1913 [Chloroflexota bacterium]|nr:hypothetical protein [Chloroflexota bacterium]